MILTQHDIRRYAKSAAMVRGVLAAWDYKTWGPLLADDVVLTMHLGAADTDGSVADVDKRVRFSGREAGEIALNNVYGYLMDDVSLLGQLFVGHEAILFGELNVTIDVNEPQSHPIAAYLHFNDNGKVQRMRIETVDLRLLLTEIWGAVTDNA
jgi:hypothetical protein